MPALYDYQCLLAQSPFREAQVWGENADRHFPDAQSLIGWIDQPSLVPFLAVVPEPHKQTFRDTVVARMLTDTAQPDGAYFVAFRRINASAARK